MNRNITQIRGETCVNSKSSFDAKNRHHLLRSKREWPKMTMPELRLQVHIVLDEFMHAHQRPIFDEILLWYNTYSAVVCSNRDSKANNSLFNDEMIVKRSLSSMDERKISSTSSSNRQKKQRSNPTFVEKDSHLDSMRGKMEYSNRAWGDILNDISHLLPYMTIHEHDLVCRLASICLLSYLVPHASPFPTLDCADGKSSYHYIAQSARQTNSVLPKTSTDRASSSRSSDGFNFRLLPLEDLLEHSLRIHNMSSVQYDPATIQHEKLISSLWHFLQTGLRPFLASRPLSPPPPSSSLSKSYCTNNPKNISSSCVGINIGAGVGAIDLLHVLAMAISPEIPKHLRGGPPSADHSRNEEEDSEHTPATTTVPHINNAPTNIGHIPSRAERLMSCLQPFYFQISLAYRAEIVHILSENLVLSEITKNDKNLEQSHEEQYQHQHQYQDSGSEDGLGINDAGDCTSYNVRQSNFFNGGIVHMRVALQIFAHSTLVGYQVIYARQTLVNIAIDCGERRFVEEEMKALITSLCGSQHYACTGNVVVGSGNVNDPVQKVVKCCRNNFSDEEVVASPRQQERQVHNRRFVVRYSPIISDSIMRSPSTFLEQVRMQHERNDHRSCMYCAKGDILRDLIIRYNGSRYYADGVFTRMTLLNLSNALVSILKRIAPCYDNDKEITMAGTTDKTQIEGKEEINQKNQKLKLPVACQVTTLLDCTRSLFYFLLNVRAPTNKSIQQERNTSLSCGMTKDVTEKLKLGCDEGQQLENKTRDIVIGCAIQFLVSPDERISTSASSLLSLALAYYKKDQVSSHLSKVFQAIKFSMSLEHIKKRIFQDVVTVASRLSYGFAKMTLSLLINVLEDMNVEKKINDVINRRESILYLISSIALAQPCVVAIQIDTLKDIYLRGDLDDNDKKHIIAIFLSCRSAYNFNDDERALHCHRHATDLLSTVQNPWSLFQLGRHAFCTSNFGIAHTVFTRLQHLSSSSSSYLWFSALSKIAQAEYSIMQEASLGIPTALPMLDSAINIIRSLPTFTANKNFAHVDASLSSSLPIASFQVDMLCRRKDFLNLCLMVRGICAEMRLTDTIASRTTRPYVHQRNLSNCFHMLASQYAKISKLFGIIHCQQTRTTLRTLFAVSHFMAVATRKVFCENIRKGSGGSIDRNILQNENAMVSPSGDKCHSLSKALQKLKTRIIDPMNDSVEPMIRAEAMLQIVNAVLKSPTPFARGFLTLKSLPRSTIRLYDNIDKIYDIKEYVYVPLNTDNDDDRTDNGEAEIIEVQAGVSCKLHVSGFLPNECLQKSNVIFSQVIMWHTVSYDGPLPGEEDGEDQPTSLSEEEKDEHIQNVELLVTNSCQLLPGAKFLSTIECAPIRREGYYKVEVKLGVRDVRFGEYEIPVDCGVIFLCILDKKVEI